MIDTAVHLSHMLFKFNCHCKGGSEIADVQAGDLLYLPSSMDHAVENAGPNKLIHISVTIPAFDIEVLYDTRQIKKQRELKSGSHYQ